MTDAFSGDDLVIDRELADIDASFRFLLDVTPVDLVEARRRFHTTGRTPDFAYRPLADDPAVAMQRLDNVVIEVSDAALASLLLAKQRELRLQLEMLACRDSDDFLPLSIELYGGASPALLAEAEDILSSVPPPESDGGPWLDADAFLKRGAGRARPLPRDRPRHRVPRGDP
jgi:hypothetical protein